MREGVRMMPKPSDERLVAYLDGELDESARAEVDAWLDHDPAAREELNALAVSAQTLRAAFDEVLHEPVPERLLAAARGETGATVIDLQTVRQKRSPRP